MAVLLARLRMPLVWLAVVLLAVGPFVGVPVWLAFGVFAVALAVYFRVGTVRRPPVEVALPVRGRWQALNTPADKVPSHGLHAYGQTYAIDLVHDPVERPRPPFGWRPVLRPPEDFPAFGQPVLAPADGVVVRARDRSRDHLSRNSWPALLLLVAEGAVREARGPAGILGNHLVLDLGGGVYAVLAHLRRGSLRVGPGDRVTAGEQVADCGNTGNSTEPHVHLQLMDHPSVLFAAGLPLRFDRFEVDGVEQHGVPSSRHPFLAPASPAGRGRG
jgi:murein DD-endopeptidase MepM/ murein hydrolase activator NlpD